MFIIIFRVNSDAMCSGIMTLKGLIYLLSFILFKYNVHDKFIKYLYKYIYCS